MYILTTMVDRVDGILQYRGRIAPACQGACAGGDGVRLVVFVLVCAGVSVSGCATVLADLGPCYQIVSNQNLSDFNAVTGWVGFLWSNWRTH